MFNKLFFIFCMFMYNPITQALILEDLIKEDTLVSTLSNKKIGYYTGSFDPLHLGHEATIHEILKQQLCEYVLVYPAWGGDTYKNRTHVNIRLKMLFAAFKHHPKIIVTQLHPLALQQTLMQPTNHIIADKPTVTTKIPGVTYIGIIGSDTAIDTSKDLKRLSVFMQGIQISEKYKEHTIGSIIAIPVQSFIIGLRAQDSIDFLKGQFSDRPILHTIKTNYTHNSSTQVRQAIKNNETTDNLLNPAVKALIIEHKLYGAPHDE